MAVKKFQNLQGFVWKTIHLIFGVRCSRYFWGIWVKIYSLPNFNMLFQLMLTKFFKSELFRVYRKLITWSTNAKGLLWTEPWNVFFKASTKFEPITCALLVWLSYNWSHWKGMKEAKVHNFVINRNVTNRGKFSVQKKHRNQMTANYSSKYFTEQAT